MLAELGQVALHHDIQACFGPAGVIEAAHLATQLLHVGGRHGLEDPPVGFLVAEQQGLAGHHEMLGAGVSNAIEFQTCVEPLAETALGDASVPGGLVPPEHQVVGLQAMLELLQQRLVRANRCVHADSHLGLPRPLMGRYGGHCVPREHESAIAPQIITLSVTIQRRA